MWWAVCEAFDVMCNTIERHEKFIYVLCVCDELMEKRIFRGLEPRGDGFILSPQVFCVQNGYASDIFLTKSAALIAKCFKCAVGDENKMIKPHGLSWDFMVAVFRGSDVSDVVAVCGLVEGCVDGGRHYMYVFDVCTDTSMGNKGICTALMRAVRYLCSLAVGVNGWINGELWLVLDVDLHQTPKYVARLKKMYSKCGFKEEDAANVKIQPFEGLGYALHWGIPYEQGCVCQMWQKVGAADLDLGVCLNENVLAELCNSILGARFSVLLARLDHMMS